jgi:methylthioribulose-1-phosphate dehydratase
MTAGPAGGTAHAADAALAAAAEALCAAGRRLAARGWLEATSGNLSCRVDGRRIAVTLSGREKGALTPADIVAIDGRAPPPAGVSAETPLHLSLYRRDPAIGAVLHVHSLAATLASQRAAGRGGIVLEGYEMLKALAGVATHEASVTLPVFANDQDVPALAERVEARLGHGPGMVGYLLAGHGLYAWGGGIADAMRHVEALDFLLTCELEKERLFR